MKIAIVVQKEDIRGATRGNCEDCPVARALNRRFCIPQGVSGYRSWKVFLSGAHSPSYTPGFGFRSTELIGLPNVARQFIRSFDNCKPVKPFTFTLEISEPLALLAPLTKMLTR